MFFFFSSRRRHTRYWRDWSSDVCSSDLGGYLLHHEEGQTYETEAVAEVFEHDTAAYEHEARGLVKGQEGVGHDGKVEHQGERKEAFLESPVCYVVAGEDTSDDDSGRSERAVEQARKRVVSGKSVDLGGRRLFQKT